MSDPYQIVASAEALAELIARLRRETCIALDTEFVWERTYYVCLGLVQVGLADGTCYLIDPIAIGDLTSLGPIIADTGITKILHDAPQDLMILRQATGASAHRVFDTRLAAGFAGLSAVISLSNLVAELVNVHLPKEHTRTNWTKRPLAEACLEYAADDVRYLPRIAQMLRDRCRESGVEAWLDEELATLDASVLYEEKAPDEAYLRVKGAASLPPRMLAALRELAAWREGRARHANRPRRWIAEDPELVSVARALPHSRDELQRCERLNPRLAERYGKYLLAAVRRSEAVPDSDLPSAVQRANRIPSLKRQTDAILAYIRGCAEARKLDPQLVCNRDAITALLAAGESARAEDHPILRGWRAELLGSALDPLLQAVPQRG